MNFTVDIIKVGNSDQYAYKVTTEAGVVVEGMRDQWTDAVAQAALAMATTCGREWNPPPLSLDSPLRRLHISTDTSTPLDS